MIRCVLPFVLVACAWTTGHGRVFTTPCTHVGVQLATQADPSGFGGVGATLQITTDRDVAPCRVVYPDRPKVTP